LEYLGLHKKPKAKVHPGCKVTGSKEEEEEEEEEEEKKEELWDLKVWNQPS